MQHVFLIMQFPESFNLEKLYLKLRFQDSSGPRFGIYSERPESQFPNKRLKIMFEFSKALGYFCCRVYEGETKVKYIKSLD